MRMVDLRATTTTSGPTVEARASAGSELLRMIGMLLTDVPENFDVGPTRIAALRERVPTALLEHARTLSTGLNTEAEADTGDDKVYLALTILGALLPEPAGVDELIAVLREEPAIVWRMLVARFLDELVEDPTELRAAFMRGEPDALEQVASLDLSQMRTEVVELFDTDPTAFGQAVREVVEGFATTLWPDVADEAMGPIERDVAYRQRLLADGVEPATVVLEATNGFELADEPAGRRVVLLPSYWLRPWLVVGDLPGHRIEVISTVVADQFLALPPEAPPPGLLKLFKALSDEGRLKLLRRMSTGPVSLAEATEGLGVAKATAHHHLSILRQAGLVTMGGEGRGTRYSLREDPAGLAHELLASYVPPRR